MNPFDKGVGTRSADPETPVEAVKAKDISPQTSKSGNCRPLNEWVS
jgi:hypothetical protein